MTFDSGTDIISGCSNMAGFRKEVNQMSNRQVSQFHNMYIERSNFADSSIALKSRVVRKFVEIFGDIPVGDVTYTHADDFQSIIAKRTTTNNSNVYVANIKPFFAWLRKRGDIERNPFDEVRLYQVEQKRLETYAVDEIQRIIKVANPTWQVISSLALCSMRRAEILNLCVADVYFDKGYIHIKPKSDNHECWEWRIKSHNEAITPFPAEIYLSDTVISLQRLMLDLIEDLKGQPYIIVKPKCYKKLMILKAEGKLDYERRNCPWGNFDRDWKVLLRRAGVKHKHFHWLRGTFATNMIKAGYSLTDTQRLMRHSSPQTTARYYIEHEEEKLVQKSNKTLKKYYVSNVP
jgi:integrase